jgi:hypothetical protein
MHGLPLRLTGDPNRSTARGEPVRLDDSAFVEQHRVFFDRLRAAEAIREQRAAARAGRSATTIPYTERSIRWRLRLRTPRYARLGRRSGAGSTSRNALEAAPDVADEDWDSLRE